MRKIGILTSGGDAPGMNAAIQSTVRMAKSKGAAVFGIMKGYSGLIEGRIIEIRSAMVEGIVGNGGTILKTSRCQEMKTAEGRQKAVEVLHAFGIEGLVVIGGDGSFKGARELSHMGIPTIGLPGTIDNDLAYTDFTIGFDTSINYVIGEMAKVRDTMLSHERIGIVEVMGNRCGDIALHAGVAADVEYIIVPERPMDKDELCESLQKRRIKGQMTSMIALAEGAGSGAELAAYIREKTKFDVKAVVLGYVQRGGSPSAFDRVIASKMGAHAVELLTKGVGNRAVGIRANEIVDDDIDEALAMKSRFDKKMYEKHYAMHNY